jgi:hypothetical protein
MNEVKLTLRVRLPSHSDFDEYEVETEGLQVTISHAGSRIIRGTWQQVGGYVLYPRSQSMPLHPLITDDIDTELRLRLRGKALAAGGVRRYDHQNLLLHRRGEK